MLIVAALGLFKIYLGFGLFHSFTMLVKAFLLPLSVQKVKTSDTGGGIAIQVTELRPGEKLYEELLIDDASLVATPHPKILRAQESKLSEIEVAGMIKDIRQAIETGDAPRLTRVVETHVAGYHRPASQNAATPIPMK